MATCVMLGPPLWSATEGTAGSAQSALCRTRETVSWAERPTPVIVRNCVTILSILNSIADTAEVAVP